jgi:NADPH2:quinone reductase
MLAKLCVKEQVPLVAIVRSAQQEKILTDLGVTHVLDSTKDAFMPKLIDALAETGATLGFDAIGGGNMASKILTAMEQAAAKRGAEFSVYGSSVNKQVYIYGRLNTGETSLGSGFGMYWGIGGWLLTPHLETVGIERMIDPDIARKYDKKATGEKVLVNPTI